MRDRVLATEAAGWRDDPDTLLAAIVLLDQFSRNLPAARRRRLPRTRSRALTLGAIDRGWEGRYPPIAVCSSICR